MFNIDTRPIIILMFIGLGTVAGFFGACCAVLLTLPFDFWFHDFSSVWAVAAMGGIFSCVVYGIWLFVMSGMSGG